MNEDILARELERRAVNVHGAPFSVDDVRSNARSIRRRRRTAAAGVLAAVIAAAIVLPVTFPNRPSRTSSDVAGPPVITAANAPGSSVLRDGVLSRSDGSTLPLDVDAAEVQQYGVLTDGRIVVAASQRYGVRVYAPDGQLESEHQVALPQVTSVRGTDTTTTSWHSTITMSASDTLAAWIDETFRVVVLESGVPEPTIFDGRLPVTSDSIGSIDAVYGSDCANGGCTVLGGDFATTTTEVGLHDNADLHTSEPLRVAAVSPDATRWAVTFPPDEGEQFGCSGLYDPNSGKVLTRNCDTTVWSFSPDGALLMGARGDNGMWASLEILDTDLDVVRTYEPARGQTIKDWGWADPRHLLVVVTGLDAQPKWTLLQIPLDAGEPEIVAGPVPGPNAEQPSVYLLSD